MNYKGLLILLLKLFFATAILYWLVSQNKLDFRLVLISFKNPTLWLLCFTLMVSQVLIGAWRWKIILSAKVKEISYLDVLRIQWIGQFFSVVLPGGVTGDLVKISYVTALQKNISKKFLLLSIFIDRLTGLNALLLLAGISSALFYKDLLALNPMLKTIIYINIFLFLGSCGIILLLFVNKNLQNKILNIIPSKKITTLFETIWSFSDHKKIIAEAIFISGCAHVLGIATFWIINLPFFERPIELKYLLSLVPLGQAAIAIPVSPAGIGVGHAAFDRLFHFIGHNNGASLFNVYWVVLFVANLCGVIPFVLTKEKNAKSLQDSHT